MRLSCRFELRLGELEAAEVLNRRDVDLDVRIGVRDRCDDHCGAGKAAALCCVHVAEIEVGTAAHGRAFLGGEFFGMGEVFDHQRGHGESPGKLSGVGKERYSLRSQLLMHRVCQALGKPCSNAPKHLNLKRK